MRVAAAAVICAALVALLLFTLGSDLDEVISQISLTMMICAAIAFVAARGRGWRIAWFNVAAVGAILYAATAWVVEAPPDNGRRQEWDGAKLFVADPAMGHRPETSFQTPARLWIDDRLIYDVTYTIGADGLRIAPPDNGGDDIPCVLFFGCSYTFGEGVDDADALPFQVGVKAQGQYRVHNFGFSGYGPHHMLAAIETGLVDRVVHCQPKYAVYQAMPHHILRAAGKWSWDWRGPRYVLDERGEAVRSGNFSDQRSPALEKSALVRRFRPEHEPTIGEVTPEDIRLLYAIVAKSRRLLLERYPGIEFHVIEWDTDEAGPTVGLFTGEHQDSYHVHMISKILPARDDAEKAYHLSPDIHPSPLTYRLIADYVVEKILHLPPAEAE